MSTLKEQATAAVDQFYYATRMSRDDIPEPQVGWAWDTPVLLWSSGRGRTVGVLVDAEGLHAIRGEDAGGEYVFAKSSIPLAKLDDYGETLYFLDTHIQWLAEV